MDSTFILSLVYGHLFSKGVDSAMAVSKRHINEKEFSDILDRFDRGFIENNDAEITLSGCDMQSVVGKRVCLIPLAEKYISQDNADISRNLKRDYIKTAGGEIFGQTDWEKERSSEVVGKYLSYFYDLVFMKEISGIPAGYRALLNAYTDNQHDINLDLYQRIQDLEKAIRELLKNETGPVDFKLYYEEVERRFTAKKRGEYRNLVGEEPDETSYIDAFITKEEEQIPVLSFLEEWFRKTESGVILIHGEPGHGKTTLCGKASFEFYKGRFLKDKANNVVAVSLNTGKNPQIVKDGKVKLSNALVFQVEADDEKSFSFEDCRGALLFLDGFDEFIDKAKETNIYNIFSFMEIVDDIADKYGIHFVILSRTIAVSRDLKELDRSYKYYRLSPLSDKQQDEWLEQHKEYDNYREAFNNLRNNKDMKKLLEVPFLFRLIVNSRFETVTSNIVELYDNLFTHLMHKRNIYNEKIEVVNDGLMNLAFEIFCTDTNMAKMDWNPQWVFAFYVESFDGDRIGFFHGTFYQYFLAKYIYSKIIKITDDNVEEFIGLFAERELDYTVRQYLSLMFKKENEADIHANIGKTIDALVETEAYLSFTPLIETGDAESSRFFRSKNIFRNVLHIAAAVYYVIQLPNYSRLDLMVRIFGCDGIDIYSEEKNRANLRGAVLQRANFIGSNLYCANLSHADLSGADFGGANLSGSILNGAYLIGAVLREAYLSEACLERAYLMQADLINVTFFKTTLIEANLSGSLLKNADLSKANLFGANLSRADLSNSNLSEAVLIGADMSRTDLSRADLTGADLGRIYINNNKLETNLCGAFLIKATLVRANLRGVNLNGADLTKADLRGSNLNEANLSRTNLREAMIDIKYKAIIDQSTEGYGSIRWISDQDTNLYQ